MNNHTTPAESRVQRYERLGTATVEIFGARISGRIDELRATFATILDQLDEQPTVGNPDAAPTTIPVESWLTVFGGDRLAVAGERCTCGAAARVVFETEMFGSVGYCGTPAGRTNGVLS